MNPWHGALQRLNYDNYNWAATVYSDILYIYTQYFDTQKIAPAGISDRAYAFSVRCLAL